MSDSQENPQEQTQVCPRCQAREIAAFSTIYEELPRAFKLGNSIFSKAGTGILGEGSIAKSALSLRTAPPVAKPMIAPVILAVFCALASVGSVGAGLDYHTASGVGDRTIRIILLIFAAIWSIGLIGTIIVAIGFAAFNRDELPRRLAAWETYWICRRCGTSFIPAGK